MNGFAVPLLTLSLQVSLLAQVSSSSDHHPYRKQIAEMDRQLSAVKAISQADLSPDGKLVAWSVEGSDKSSAIIRASSTQASGPATRITAAGGNTSCDEEAPAWSPDSKRLAFLSDCKTPGQLQLFVVDYPANHPASRLTNWAGHLSHPRWSPDGSAIALLFVDHATRAPSPMAAIKVPTGVIDEQQKTEVQRIAIVNPAGGTRQLTAPGLNIFEFDWSPDSKQLAFTAAPPPGDDNWYIAQLYTQALTEPNARSIYKPALQIALPRWSPDGKALAFIEGLMSDEGATGGEIYLLPIGSAKPRNLTPDNQSTPGWFTWRSNDSIFFTEYVGGSSAAALLNLATGKKDKLWESGETINAGPEAISLSLARTPGQQSSAQMQSAVIRSSWSTPPEVWTGLIGEWRQISHENSSFQPVPTKAESITWTNDSFQVQGWLLYPRHFDANKRYPMIVSVHGGPAWIFTPGWAATDFDISAFSEVGYFVFFPNPRGSFGEGEKFTRANRRDWGFGDLRDILTGIDSVVARYPVDNDRVGITGWSYGGSTSMFAVTQTNRFRAAVAGAAACDLQSYYGENSIDQWMLPYFGASVYDDPAAYARSSAITYVKQVKTPTLILVGERDGEAPPAQSFEFWHALKALKVPTELVVYANEGHGFVRHENRVDLIERSLTWFMRYMPPR